MERNKCVQWTQNHGKIWSEHVPANNVTLSQTMFSTLGTIGDSRFGDLDLSISTSLSIRTTF